MTVLQGPLRLAASCFATALRSLINSAAEPLHRTVVCIVSGVILDLMVSPLAGVSPYHHLQRLTQAPVVSALTHYLPGLALVVLWQHLRMAAEAHLWPGVVPLLNTSAGRAGHPWHAHWAFHTQLLCLAWLTVGLPVQLVSWCVPRLLPLQLPWYRQAPGTTLDVQLACLLLVAVLRRRLTGARINWVVQNWLLAAGV
jgi:hypothetical protein